MEINSERFVLSVLSDDAFVLLNKKLLRYLKGDGSAGVFLGEIISMYKYNLNNQTLEPDNSFPCLTRRIAYAVGLSEYKQHRILEKFKNCGLVKVQLKGFPATRYVSINFDMLAKILANDDLKYKEVDKQQFYNELNGALNAFASWSDKSSQAHIVENAEHCCDNMGDSIRGTIILISKHYIEGGNLVTWSPRLVGQVRQWVRNRGLGKPFDFTLVTRTLGAMQKVQTETMFLDFINEFVREAKATQDVHFSNQKYDYKQLLK
jgi:hypothetical protein